MFDSSDIVERMKKPQDSIEFYTNVGEIDEEHLRKALHDATCSAAIAAKKSSFSLKAEKVVVDGDSTVDRRAKWCTIRQISLAHNDIITGGWQDICQVKTSCTLKEVRRLVAKHGKVSLNLQRFQFGEVVLCDDGMNLREYGVKENSVVSLLLLDSALQRNFLSEVEANRVSLKKEMQKDFKFEYSNAGGFDSAELISEIENKKSKEGKTLTFPEETKTDDSTKTIENLPKKRSRNRLARARGQVVGDRVAPRTLKHKDGIDKRITAVLEEQKSSDLMETNTTVINRYQKTVEAADEAFGRKAIGDALKNNRRKTGRNTRRSYGISRQKSSGQGFQRTVSNDDFFASLTDAQNGLFSRKNTRSVLRSLALLSLSFTTKQKTKRKAKRKSNETVQSFISEKDRKGIYTIKEMPSTKKKRQLRREISFCI